MTESWRRPALEIVGGVSLAATNPTFYVSFDNGQTWISRPVTDSHGNLVAPPTGSLVPLHRMVERVRGEVRPLVLRFEPRQRVPGRGLDREAVGHRVGRD
jgi:hypothetical protein